jgi:polysaccharide biosynthesis/export protein
MKKTQWLSRFLLLTLMQLAFLQLICPGSASAADVLLGPGDVLKISIYDHPDLALETRISEAGSINFPLVGEVVLGGLSTSAAEKKLAVLLVKDGFIRKAQVNIIVTQLLSQQVSVLGHVNKPGRYQLDGRRSLTDMLAIAGGVSVDGSDQVTLIRIRDGKTEKNVVDIVAMIRSGDMPKNLVLAANDLIFVEPASQFYIYGEVQHPGMYRLERSMTVLQALSAGGGLTPRGTEHGVRIKRRDTAGTMQTIEVKHDGLVQEDDVVYVQENLF